MPKEEAMFVSKSMTRKVITVRPETSVIEARDLMKSHKIRHLPVVEDGDFLVGIITDRDVRSVLPAAFYPKSDTHMEVGDFSAIKVQEAMTPNPHTVSPQDTIEDVLLQIQTMRVGAFPVVDRQGRLQGLISVRDLLRAFINVLGIEEPGTLLGILVEEKLGQMKIIVDAITEENISFGSILVARHWESNMRAVFPYLLTNNVRRVKKKLAALGFTILDPLQWTMDRLPKHD
jgi:acetoin utilization protein AcuB